MAIETVADYVGMIPGRRPARKPGRPQRATDKGKRRRRTPWSLARLVRECRSAPAVWIALSDLADAHGSVSVTPTRDELACATGLSRLRTISTGLTALERGGWIDRVHVPVCVGGRQTATCLRIVLRRMGRKSTPTKPSAVWVENRPHAKGRKSTQDFFSEEEGAASRARAFEGGAASRSSAPQPVRLTCATRPANANAGRADEQGRSAELLPGPTFATDLQTDV
jgi:hypothetical protein